MNKLKDRVIEVHSLRAGMTLGPKGWKSENWKWYRKGWKVIKSAT